MKRNYILIVAVLVSISSFAQITTTTYRGAFAPAPAAMWTDSWANFDPQNTIYPAPNVDVTTNITSNTTWTKGNTYLLKTQVYVKNNATLTIEAGVIIRADHTAVGAGLFVTKGSKVIAIGTAAEPIVFTSDNAPGNRVKGDWGGVILLGKGSYNINNGINNIEGIAASTDTEFGGGLTPDDNDDSGTLKYVRIEFGGYVYAANQEINGLTFGAVGRGTTIDYVQVSHANDDSFEWFGGTVNCTHLIAYRGLDDDFDTDNGFSGSVQFILGVRDPQVSDNPTISTSEGFESDNNNNSAASYAGTPGTHAIFTNCTLIGPSYRLTLPNGGTIATGYKRAARLRRNTQLQIFNSLFLDFQEGLEIKDAPTELNAFTNNSLKWKNNILAGIISNPLISTTVANASTLATWYASNNNSTVATNAGILTAPYNLTDATIYSGLDYRPSTGSIAETGADFTDPSLAAVLSNHSFSSNSNGSLKAYPNPFNTSFKLSLASQSNSDVKVTIHDITGRMIESKTLKFAEVNNYEFGLNYNSGVYIAVVKQGQSTESYKLIKN